jgi:hypothetical protein
VLIRAQIGCRYKIVRQYGIAIASRQ